MHAWLFLSLLVAQQTAVEVPVAIPVPVAAVDPVAEAAPSGAAVSTEPRPVLRPVDAPAAADEEVRVHLLDLVEVDGVRSNQLVGTGLVVGLLNTGDTSNAARRAISNLLRRTHLNVDLRDVSAGNVALVTVTATLPPFKKAGTALDVSVQSVGEAESLLGGMLVQTPLYGADGNVYVVAQGSVSVGGFAAAGQAASVTQNHPVAGIVIGGGLVEREVPMEILSPDGFLHLHLRSPSYVTAGRVAQRLNARFPGSTRALDKATLRFLVPPDWRSEPVALLADLDGETVVPAEEAVVVINERTGTIVAGNQVRITTAAISHGNLTVTIAESPVVSQPAPFAEGETVSVPRTDIEAQVEQRQLMVIRGGTSVSELADALNRLGVSSRDLVSIFQALARAGHLHARLEVM